LAQVLYFHILVVGLIQPNYWLGNSFSEIRKSDFWLSLHFQHDFDFDLHDFGFDLHDFDVDLHDFGFDLPNFGFDLPDFGFDLRYFYAILHHFLFFHIQDFLD